MKGLKTFSSFNSFRGKEFYEYRYEHKYQALVKLKFSPTFRLCSKLIYVDYLRVAFNSVFKKWNFASYSNFSSLLATWIKN